MKKVIVGIAVLAILGIVLASSPGTQADVKNATTTVTVNEYVAIGMSNNLSVGIDFGSVDPDTDDNNATHNYDGASAGTSYWINISSDSNVNIDVCVGDNESLKLGSYVIGNGNYTWVNSTTSATDAWMIVGNSTAMTTTASYTRGGEDISPGNYNYFRFWLDIPKGQAAGDYINQVSFKGIKTGDAC